MPPKQQKGKSAKGEAPNAPFFILKYGNNFEKIFNFDITAILLVDKIRDIVRGETEIDESLLEILDFADMSGKCIMLHEELNGSAKDLFERRGSYYLVSVQENGSNKSFTCLYTPPEPEEGKEAIKVPQIVAGAPKKGAKKK